MIEEHEQGWICLHRKILNNFLFIENRELSRAEAWLYIILKVNHADIDVLIGNQKFTCKRGQSLKSYDTWGKLFNWSKSKVVRFFHLLQNENMIVIENLQKTIRLTVCNYGKYNDLRNANETQTKRKRNASETQAESNNKDNNENNENNDKKEEATAQKLENLKPKELNYSKILPDTWQLWIKYKKEQFKETYKSQITEQTAINNLIELSNNNDNTAKEIINQSIANLWKGLFELKQRDSKQSYFHPVSKIPEKMLSDGAINPHYANRLKFD